MKRLAIVLPMLLAACAPSLQNVPKPVTGEIIVEVNTYDAGSELSPEREAAVISFADLSALMILQKSPPLPGYARFHFPDDEKAIEMLSAKDQPLHVRMVWQADQAGGTNTIRLVWESRPIGGRLISLKLAGTATDPAVRVREIEDRYLNAYLDKRGMRLLASGR